MPHQLTLLGPSRAAVLRRGAVKANLIHHLAHAGGEAVLRRLGRGFVPPRDWVPASGRTAPEALVRAFDAALAVPTGKLTRAHPALRALDALAAEGEFWAHVGLAFNLLRVWEGDAAFRESLAHADAALALEPEWAWGRLLRGEIKRSLIDYAGGAEDLKRALALDPEWAWAHGFLARALFQGGTDATGLVPMDEAVRLAPRDGFLLCWRAEAYRRLGRPEDAARDFDAGLRLDPSYDQGWGWRARLLDAQGRHDEAAASLRRGIALCPLFEKARRQLVRSLRGAGRTAEALAELDRAAALNHRNDWLGVWRAEGQPDGASARSALAELDAYLSRHPRDARAQAWKGETLAQIGRLPEALAVARRGAQARPGRRLGVRLARRDVPPPWTHGRGARRPGPGREARPGVRPCVGVARPRAPAVRRRRRRGGGPDARDLRTPDRVRVDLGLARRGATRARPSEDGARGPRRRDRARPRPRVLRGAARAGARRARRRRRRARGPGRGALTPRPRPRARRPVSCGRTFRGGRCWPRRTSAAPGAPRAPSRF